MFLSEGHIDCETIPEVDNIAKLSRTAQQWIGKQGLVLGDGQEQIGLILFSRTYGQWLSAMNCLPIFHPLRKSICILPLYSPLQPDFAQECLQHHKAVISFPPGSGRHHSLNTYRYRGFPAEHGREWILINCFFLPWPGGWTGPAITEQYKTLLKSPRRRCQSRQSAVHRQRAVHHRAVRHHIAVRRQRAVRHHRAVRRKRAVRPP